MRMILTTIALVTGFTLAAQPADTTRWRKLSNMAASLLAQTDVARQALANHDASAAQASIRQALTLTEMMQSTAPPADPLMVPISVEYDSSESFVPAIKHAGRLKKNADISEVNGDYNATILNATAARQHLEEAQAALYKGDMAAADSDLAGVHDAVSTRSYSGELPLVQARDNLTLARTRVVAGDFKDAVLPLSAASRALDRFAQRHPGTSVGKQAETMRIQIAACADQIAKDHTEALNRITGWYDQVTDWFNSGMAQ